MHKILKFLFRALSFCLAILPRPIFLLKAKMLGGLLLFFAFRKKVVLENLQLAYPDWTEEQRKQFLRKNYEHYGIVFLEILRSFYRFGSYVRKYAKVEGVENVKAALAHGGGAFVMTAHVGNWEVMAAGGPIFTGEPSTMVTKQLKPSWLHELAEEERATYGVKMACEPKTLPVVMRALKRNELVGFVMDQYTGAPVGARVPFFGVPVGSHTALATLAIRTNAVVIPARCIRQSDGSYIVRFEKPLITEQSENLDEAVLKNTAKYVAITESWIREFPDQWLWIHRRWKGNLDPLPANSLGEMLR